MEITTNANQFSTGAQDNKRFLKFRAWMILNHQTFLQIGAYLGGISGNAVTKHLRASRIPTRLHSALIEYGVPSHLLPPAKDVRRGRPRKQKRVD